MPPIDTAEDAVKKAELFLEKYHLFHKLTKVAREKDKWITEFDVAILGSEIIRIEIDAYTGSIMEYGKTGAQSER
jgi:hypothetical protein